MAGWVKNFNLAVLNIFVILLVIMLPVTEAADVSGESVGLAEIPSTIAVEFHDDTSSSGLVTDNLTVSSEDVSASLYDTCGEANSLEFNKNQIG